MDSSILADKEWIWSKYFYRLEILDTKTTHACYQAVVVGTVRERESDVNQLPICQPSVHQWFPKWHDLFLYEVPDTLDVVLPINSNPNTKPTLFQSPCFVINFKPFQQIMWMIVKAVGSKVGVKCLWLLRFFLIYEKAVAVW